MQRRNLTAQGVTADLGQGVAVVATFLLGPDARAFTGAPVTMDLGWTAR